ncbi:hypothetical protein FVEG_00408 [Fusarium verticillioides 7600]|uniref:Uncharacterized protein n=1 Tax=Gibberella moniliformis (strain M3125 / FGSC 7600) TaxID=334819 RepID=W7LLC8_GIBM7|nr:hypothetical protein FVEG_00408 [Fusarium verticillioides 7600]EWG36335.1 hypothetical protein FVEG_00408 [Fusarium verticillioides 7600]RBQ84120.1 hypothetical protein FVER53263_00408 [Fusarium verticillioides]
MGMAAKLMFKIRKIKNKLKIRRRLKKDAANVTHEERLAQVQRVDGTEHKIERSVDVMVAARRSVYGAHMLPQTTEFGVTVEEARELHKRQKEYNDGKQTASQDAATQDGGIWDGGVPDNRI